MSGSDGARCDGHSGAPVAMLQMTGAHDGDVTAGVTSFGVAPRSKRREGIAVMKPAPDADAHRMIATVAWLYHTRGLRQGAIAERRRISQSRVSRLLEQAVELGIVRTVVIWPVDEQSILEQE